MKHPRGRRTLRNPAWRVAVCRSVPEVSAVVAGMNGGGQ